MSLLEIFFIGIGLSMDAVAVSMTNGMVCKRISLIQYVAMPIFFGIFQGVMPLIGYFAGGLFAELISQYAGIIILLILGAIGGKMIYDGIKGGEGNGDRNRCLTVGLLFFQGVATSIDAFAVGIGFSAVRVAILPAVAVISLTTAVLVIAAIIIGKKFGDLLGSKAEVLGGAILVIIGIKAVLPF